jgi:type I restriction enzyme S subunit
MTELKDLKIRDLGRVVTGKTPPTDQAEYFDGDELFVSPKDLCRDSYYVEATETRISEKALEKFRGQVIPRDAVMFTSLSFAFGKIGLASRRCMTNQQINTVVVNEHHVAKFVYYLLRVYEPFIFSYNSGIDTPIVPKSVFENIPIQVPTKDAQRKIAAILSAYDDLVANNQQRIALLEEMAEEIYREWFVRMRFPGALDHTGRIPSNWSVVQIGSRFRTFLGGTPSRSEAAYWGGHIPWINSSEVNKIRVCAASELITERGLEESAAKLMPSGTTVLAITGATLGQVSYTTIEVAANQSVVGIFDPDDVANIYVHRYLKANIESLIQKQSGGGQQHINKDIVEKEPILLPTPDLLARFNQVAGPIYSQVERLLRCNDVLATTKAALLPRLIAGKLNVDYLDIRLPRSMRADAEVAA